MQQLWTGEEVTFEGELWQVLEARMAITPVQKPHPPIWIAAQSAGAAHRAANVRDACLIGHQPIWEDFRFLAGKYRQAFVEVGKGSRGLLAAKPVHGHRQRPRNGSVPGETCRRGQGRNVLLIQHARSHHRGPGAWWVSGPLPTDRKKDIGSAGGVQRPDLLIRTRMLPKACRQRVFREF